MEKFFIDYLERIEDLHRDLAQTFSGLSPESLDWVPYPDTNSLCVLVQHVIGSERYWIGDVALEEPSNRTRDAEFEAREFTEEALKEQLSTHDTYVRNGVGRLTLADLEQPRTIAGRDQEFTVSWALLHALEHTATHIGHAQLTRQLWEQRTS